jgi:3-oxoacyl-[acyl-carrier protein] reductase
MSLTGRTAFVTGGSRGIGLGIVQALLDKGTSVAFTSSSAAGVAGARKALGAAADRALGLVANVRALSDV